MLADPDASAFAVEWAVFGGALALALMGRGDEVAVVAERGHAIENQVDGLLRYLTAFGEVRALVLAGDFDTAAQRSADIIRITSAGQYLAWGMANVLVGTVESARGHFADTVPRMEQTVAALTSESAASWSFPARLLLAQAYCALGRADAGAKMVAELRTRFSPPRRGVRPAAEDRRVVAGRRGGKCQRRNRIGAEPPRTWRPSPVSGRSRCWRCTMRCGSATSPSWTGSSTYPAAPVAGWRAAIAAHAMAVRDRDAAGIYAAAQQFEQIGAKLSAADAAAQAAVAFEGADDRRRSVEAAAAANRLAAECGGIRTPALDLAAHPLPLTVREREIANLVAAGLSNRDIADRLTVSVRTVEGHLYRACIKLDISDREELAALIRTGSSG